MFQIQIKPTNSDHWENFHFKGKPLSYDSEEEALLNLIELEDKWMNELRLIDLRDAEKYSNFMLDEDPSNEIGVYT